MTEPMMAQAQNTCSVDEKAEYHSIIPFIIQLFRYV